METKELTDKATLILDKMLDAVNTGIDKAPEFIGGLAEEYVTYYVIENLPIASLCFVICALVVMILGLRLIYKHHEEIEIPDQMAWSIFISCAPFVISLAIFISSARQIAQAYYAPKAFLIENIRK